MVISQFSIEENVISWHTLLAVSFLYAKCSLAWYCIDFLSRSLVLNAFEISTGSWKSCLFCWKLVRPPFKKVKLDQGDNRNCNEPSQDMLVDLSREITSFWKPLGLKLKVPNVELEAIQCDNIQFPWVKDKAFQVLSAWIDQGLATFHDLSKGLKGLGKKKLADKYSVMTSQRGWKFIYYAFYLRSALLIMENKSRF